MLPLHPSPSPLPPNLRICGFEWVGESSTDPTQMNMSTGIRKSDPISNKSNHSHSHGCQNKFHIPETLRSHSICAASAVQLFCHGILQRLAGLVKRDKRDRAWGKRRPSHVGGLGAIMQLRYNFLLRRSTVSFANQVLVIVLVRYLGAYGQFPAHSLLVSFLILGHRVLNVP